MSRSRKKHPHCNASPRHSYVKRWYNRRLRRSTGIEDVSDGNHYRRLNETWNICDFPCHGPTWEQFKVESLREDPDADLRELRRWWLRVYGGK